MTPPSHHLLHCEQGERNKRHDIVTSTVLAASAMSPSRSASDPSREFEPCLPPRIRRFSAASPFRFESESNVASIRGSHRHLARFVHLEALTNHKSLHSGLLPIELGIGSLRECRTREKRDLIQIHTQERFVREPPP